MEAVPVVKGRGRPKKVIVVNDESADVKPVKPVKVVDNKASLSTTDNKTIDNIKNKLLALRKAETDYKNAIKQ